MRSKSNKPAAILWSRLKKNVSAVIGLCIILFAAFISVFCYVIMPDNSPNANEMNLSLSTLKPGTKVRLIKVPVRVTVSEKSIIDKVFTGSNPDFRFIAIDSVWVSGNDVYYFEYNTMHLDNVEPIHNSLGGLISGSADFHVENKVISWVDKDKTSHEMDIHSLGNMLINERVVTRNYFMGTDRFGRDLFSRVLAGTRISMAVGLIAVLISLIIGITLGSLAGFFRGKVDELIMWLINVVWSIPTLLLVIAITLALGKGFTQVFIAVGLTMWVEVARVVRGQIFSMREKEFVEAGKALGFSNSRIIIRHIVPNIISPVIVISAANFASAILLEAGLSFLGMGAQPPTPSWGMMIKENYAYIIVDAAYLAIIPGLAIMVMVLAFTWLGNGLRDALDAKESSGSRI